MFFVFLISQTKRSLDAADSGNPTKRGRQEIVAYDDKSKALVASDGSLKRHSSLRAPIMKLEGHQVRCRLKSDNFMFCFACTIPSRYVHFDALALIDCTRVGILWIDDALRISNVRTPLSRRLCTR